MQWDDQSTVTVDLNDLVKFTHDVKNVRVFAAVSGHYIIKGRGGDSKRLKLLIDSSHWKLAGQTIWHGDAALEMQDAVKRLERDAMMTNRSLRAAIGQQTT